MNMKLHNLLDDMLDSKSKTRILRLLFGFPGREFTEREIADMIGMSPNTVNLALRDLRKTNVFVYKRIGRSHSYQCDRDSVLFPLFTELFARERLAKDELMGLLKKKLKDIGTCILFGSFARGEEEFDSDLDLLIIADDKAQAKSITNDLEEELSRRFSITLTPLIFSRKEFASKRKENFIREALSEGKTIVGDIDDWN